jgi:membrane protein DedA with SNARE-associated domain
MNAWSFTLYTAIGSLVWDALLIGAGYQLGDRWELVGEWVGRLQYVVVAAILAWVAWFAWTRLLSPTHRARHRAELEEQQREADLAQAVLDATD